MIQTITKTNLTPKIKSFPKGLIYRVPRTDFYKLIETKSGAIVGDMLAYPELNSVRNIYNVSAEKKVFKIYSLDINFFQQRKGWGEYFMNFAKQESYKQGCEGRLYLVAYNPFTSPHVFYKKQGLVARDKRINERLNSCIKKRDFFSGYPACEMYLPFDNVNKYQEPVKKIGFWQNIKRLLGIKR